jgi:hypothetical protein
MDSWRDGRGADDDTAWDVAEAPRVFETRRDCVSRQLSERDLSGAAFDRTVFDRCDFARANLRRTSWRGAKLIACTMSGALLADSVLVGAEFVDCDLRSVDLSASKLGAAASMFGARFMRCDLRWTSWRGRDLSGVELVGCKVFGVFGAPTIFDAEIVAPDLSPRGDGTKIGVAEDLLRRWRR